MPVLLPPLIPDRVTAAVLTLLMAAASGCSSDGVGHAAPSDQAAGSGAPTRATIAGAGAGHLAAGRAGTAAGAQAAGAGAAIGGSSAAGSGGAGAASVTAGMGSIATAGASGAVADAGSSGAATHAGSGGAGANAGASAAGTPAAASGASFLLGADITDQEPQPEATRAQLLALLQQHGFNAVRLRTFVDPKASDGYDRANGYGDLAHTVAFGKQIKAAGMQLLLDFHYSDNWADPGKQCVPVAWQSYTTIEQLAAALHDYTHDAVTQLVQGGARPDMVQLGNEITPGMLLHRCDAGGLPTGSNPITGSTSNWKNLGTLLAAGAKAVRDVDPAILLSLHIDRGGDKPADAAGTALRASSEWLTNALGYVTIDAFGLSCYQRYQGDPNDVGRTQAGWSATFGGLAAKFPDIRLFAAEYGPLQREINDVVYGLANKQGLGTFNWEPTTRGDWNSGHDLLRLSGDTYAPQPDLALYDAMKTAYADRL